MTLAGNVLPDWCLETFLPASETVRHKICYGGRGSGKSWAFATMCVLRASVRPVRILCARELQVSIRDSVHALLVDQIARLNLQHKFEIYDREIRGTNGSLILFKGLRGMRNDASAIRSLEGIDICWIEEAQYISRDSIDTLLPTIRKKRAEIWYTLNPNLSTDPVYQMIEQLPDNAIARKVNWSDNPWFDETGLPDEREYKQRVDPDGYRHIWEGYCREYSDAQVLRGKYVIQPFEPMPDWGEPLQGADWGFSTDPTTLVRIFVFQNVLYLHREVYKVGCEIDQTPALFDLVSDGFFDARKIHTRGDPARPETISYLNRHGYPLIKSAPSWKGSVQDGVAFLRSFEQIVIHPDCKHAIEEASLWSFKVNKLTGDVLTDLADGNDHIWDAVRYALAPLIRRSEAQTVNVQVPSL